MSKRIPLLLAVSFLLSSCATGTSTQTTPTCPFDKELLEETPRNLPEATAGDRATLRQNSWDRKEAYKRAHNRHRDLAQEVKNCMAAQAADRK